MMIREKLEANLNTAKNLMNTLELPNYCGMLSKPLESDIDTLSVTAFEERCRVINSLLMNVRKNLRNMIRDDYESCEGM